MSALAHAPLAHDHMSAPQAFRPYHFVYQDEVGQFHATAQHLFAGDEAAHAHARRMLAGAALVVVYQDGRKVSLLANL